MNVLVVCAVGMSSSFLVKNLRDIAQRRNDTEIKIGSCASNQVEKYSSQTQVILLSPQLLYLEKAYLTRYPEIRVKVIPANYYGMKDDSDMEAIYNLIFDRSENQESWIQKSNVGRRIVSFSYYLGTNKVVRSINDGMMSVLPITLIGSVFILIRSFVSQYDGNLVMRESLVSFLNLGIDSTTNLIAVFTTYFITYSYAKRRKMNPIIASVNALICFFLLVGKGAGKDILDARYLGIEGLFSSMFISIVFTIIFDTANRFINQKKYNLKHSPPIIITESLKAVIPMFISITCALFFASIFYFSESITFSNWVYKSVHESISNIVGNNIYTDTAMTFFTHSLWFMGIHGGNLIGSITKPVYTSFSYANLNAIMLGEPLPYIINNQFKYLYIFGGAGSTFGLVLLMVFRARSQRLKSVGKLSLPLSIFFINETVLFGVPVVLNPIMLVPFILVAPTLGIITYVATKAHIIPIVSGYDIPWSTPMILSGFIQGGWRLALWQVGMIAASVVLWYPFFRIQDNQYLIEEQKKLLQDNAK